MSSEPKNHHKELPSFLSIPFELIAAILFHLPACDLARAESVCSIFSNASKAAWLSTCHAEYDGKRLEKIAEESDRVSWKEWYRERVEEERTTLEETERGVCARLWARDRERTRVSGNRDAVETAELPRSKRRTRFVCGIAADILKNRHSAQDTTAARRFITWQLAGRFSDPSTNPERSPPLILGIRLPFGLTFSITGQNGHTYTPGPHSPLALAETTTGDFLFLWETGQAIVSGIGGQPSGSGLNDLSGLLAALNATTIEPAQVLPPPDLTFLLDPPTSKHGPLLNLLALSAPQIYPFQLHPTISSNRSSPAYTISKRFLLAHHIPASSPTGDLEIRQKFQVAVITATVSEDGQTALLETTGEGYGDVVFLVLCETGIIAGAGAEMGSVEVWPFLEGVVRKEEGRFVLVG